MVWLSADDEHRETDAEDDRPDLRVRQHPAARQRPSGIAGAARVDGGVATTSTGAMPTGATAASCSSVVAGIDTLAAGDPRQSSAASRASGRADHRRARQRPAQPLRRSSVATRLRLLPSEAALPSVEAAPVLSAILQIKRGVVRPPDRARCLHRDPARVLWPSEVSLRTIHHGERRSVWNRFGNTRNLNRACGAAFQWAEVRGWYELKRVNRPSPCAMEAGIDDASSPPNRFPAGA